MRRFEKGALVVDLGRAEAVLPVKEQVPRENYRPGDRIRAYVADVNNHAKGAQIVLSRASIHFLTKLFAQEVPEIYEGIVTIESAAREPGGRSKIAVASRDGDVDPVGAASVREWQLRTASCRSCAAKASTSCRGARTCIACVQRASPK